MSLLKYRSLKLLKTSEVHLVLSVIEERIFSVILILIRGNELSILSGEWARLELLGEISLEKRICPLTNA